MNRFGAWRSRDASNERGSTSLLGLGEHLNAAPVAAPATRHRLNTVGDDFGLFHAEFTTDAVVMKGSDRRRFHHIKSRQVATRGAAVSVRHEITVLELFFPHS
jgi:hypothetical protein